MNIDKKANQAEFEALLRSVNRDGMDYVIEDLEKDGFFDAPASAGHTSMCQEDCVSTRSTCAGLR